MLFLIRDSLLYEQMGLKSTSSSTGLFPAQATPKQHGLDLWIGEVGIGMPLHPDERARGPAARKRVFISPDLGHDLALVGAGTRRSRITAVAST